MFRLFVVTVVLALAALFGRAALVPGDFHFDHKIDIAATPKAIMPYLDNFRGWTSWAPSEMQDIGLVKTYSGAQSGPGAVYDWVTSSNGGSGRMTIVSETSDRLRIDIDQRSPVARTARLEFQLAADGDLTHATATIIGHDSVLTRLRYPFGVPDTGLSTRFDDALTNLKLVVEAD